MSKEYVTKLENAYRVAGTRVSLDSVVHAWRAGASPETIAEMFPILALEEVYGAVAFYLGNQQEVDAYLRQGAVEFEVQRQKSVEALRRDRPELYRRLMAANEKRTAAQTPELAHQ